MRVAAVQFDITWENKPVNHERMEQLLLDARPEPGSFVLLPELGDTGFSFNLDTIVDDLTLPWARSIAATHRIYLQVGHAERGPDGRGRNCTTIVSPMGEYLGTYEKIHPFSYGKEIEHFSGGAKQLVTQCGEANICPAICYDLRFPELFRLGALSGAEVFTIGANWPDARQHHWRSLNIARAIENQAFVIACNRTGRDPHLSYAGGSMIVSPKGEILAEADDAPQVLSAEIDLDALRSWRRDFPALKDIRRPLLGELPIMTTEKNKHV